MKVFATGMLVAAAVVYLIARANEDGAAAWVGYVRAGAEAAMVGALADWFAVTALFRHPLGIPIPHTAIIPKRKDQIGRSLGEFVQGNFLTHEVLSQRLAGVHVGQRLGHWLSEPAHAERAAGAVTDAMRGTIEVLDDRTVQEGIGGLVERRLRATEVAPLRRPGDRRQRRGRAPPAPARRRDDRRLRVPRRQPGHDAPAPRQGVAVVGARADRRPRVQEDLRWRAALPRRGARRPRPRGAGVDRGARAQARRPPAQRPGDDRQGRGAEARAAVASRGAGVAAVAVGRAEAGDAGGRRRPAQRAAPPPRPTG